MSQNDYERCKRLLIMSEMDRAQNDEEHEEWVLSVCVNTEWWKHT